MKRQWENEELVEQILPREHHEERLRDMAYQRFWVLQLEAPTPACITRIIHSARHTFEQQLYETTLARLPQEVQVALDALLCYIFPNATSTV